MSFMIGVGGFNVPLLLDEMDRDGKRDTLPFDTAIPQLLSLPMWTKATTTVRELSHLRPFRARIDKQLAVLESPAFAANPASFRAKSREEARSMRDLDVVLDLMLIWCIIVDLDAVVKASRWTRAPTPVIPIRLIEGIMRQPTHSARIEYVLSCLSS
jgi:hypothetical protein